MALSFQTSDNQIVQIENQTNSIKQLVKIDAPTGLGFFYEKYLENNYHFAKYDVKDDKITCFKIATKFSKHPDIFLGRKRSEIQLDNISVTLSVNDWIKCTTLPEAEMTFAVEYYIYTVNQFPVIIFFRIKKSIDEYEIKLRGFINYLIGTQLLTGNIEPMMIEDNVYDEKKIYDEKVYDQKYITQNTSSHTTQLIDIDDGTEVVATIAFATVAHKGIYITILVCGVIMTYYFVESITNQETSHSQNGNNHYQSRTGY